jgi:pilus assembly protein CpaE
MKIAVISPNKDHLQEIENLLSGKDHQVIPVIGGKGQMVKVADQYRPDLMLVDGMCCEAAELVQVEHVTSRHASTAVVLMCATQTSEFLVNSMRVGVREVLPSPAGAEALLAAVSRIEAKQKATVPARNEGQVLAFMSCKGGSGATFLATHLGLQLAEQHRVLLIDLNLQFGDALSFVHDAQPPSTLANIAHDITRLDASFLAASSVKITPNFHILAAPADVSEAMEIKPEHVESILNLAVAHYDFVLLDLGRVLDTLSIKAMDRADRIFPVLQANLPAIRNAKRLLKVFKSLGYPARKFELVVNRFERSSDIGLDEIQRSLGVSSLRTVPNSFKEVNGAINEGSALLASRGSPVSKSLTEFASSLAPPAEEARSSLLGRLFRRA